MPILNLSVSPPNGFPNEIDIFAQLEEALAEGLPLSLDLNISDNIASNPRLIRLFKALEDKPITGLNIMGDIQTDEATEALVRTLQKNPCITQLRLKPHYFSQETAAKVFHLLETNQSQVSEFSLVTRKIYSNGQIWPNYKKALAKALASALVKNTTLKSLEITDLHIDDEVAKTLSSTLKQHPQLTELNISDDRLSPQAFELLIEALKINQNIKSCSFRQWNYLSGTHRVSLFALLLKENKHLNYLNLSFNALNDQDAIMFAKALKENNNVASLNLGYNAIGKKGIEALALALEKNNTLKTLNLCGNRNNSNILTKLNFQNDVAALALAKVLKQNRSLTSLDLQNTDIDVNLLSEGLAYNRSLTALNLKGNNVNSKTLIKLSSALQKNPNLRRLNLSATQLEDNDMLALIEFLGKAPNIIELDLDANKITHKGAKILATYLENNPSLTRLNLDRNPIELEGMTALTEALKKNSTLTELAIDFKFKPDQIQAEYEACYKAIDALLSVNKTLTTFWITTQFIPCSREAYDRIAPALKRNKALLDKEGIELLTKQIEGSILSFPSAIASLVVNYAGPPPFPYIKKSRPVEPYIEQIALEKPKFSLLEKLKNIFLMLWRKFVSLKTIFNKKSEIIETRSTPADIKAKPAPTIVSQDTKKSTLSENTITRHPDTTFESRPLGLRG